MYLPTKGYQSVNLPTGLYEKIREIINNSDELGYRSITEFVAEAVRKRVEEIEAFNNRYEKSP